MLKPLQKIPEWGVPVRTRHEDIVGVKLLEVLAADALEFLKNLFGLRLSPKGAQNHK
jgi:hypothetical protein